MKLYNVKAIRETSTGGRLISFGVRAKNTKEAKLLGKNMELNERTLSIEKFITQKYGVETSSEVAVGGLNLIKLMDEYSYSIATEFATFCFKLDKDVLYTHSKERLFEMFLNERYYGTKNDL